MLADLFIYAGYGLALVLAVGLLVVGFVVRDVLALRLRRGRVETISCERLPAYVKPLCAQTERRLRDLGFEPFLCERQEEMLASDHAVRWAKVYIHLDERVFASVAVAALPDVRTTCEVELVSFFADGHVTVTMDGKAHMIVPCLDWLSLQDGYSGDLEAQWALHRKGVADHAGGRATLVDARTYTTRGNRMLRDYPHGLVREGWVRSGEQSGTYRFGFPRALRFALRILRQGKRIPAGSEGARSETESQPDAAALAQAQAAAYRRQADVVRHRPGGWLGKTALFLLSVVLFVLAFGITFSVEMVLILLAVLLVHELGHVLAMRFFRYRNLQILFIPFLGAAASGEPRQPKVHQQLIVALMGPLPGIVIGYALMHAAAPEFGGPLWQVGLVMLVVNYLNLLPLMPLDGGQIANLLLFSRYPRLRSLFTLVSAATLAYAGWIWSEPVLWALAVVLLLGVSGQMRIATLLREVQASGSSPAGDGSHEDEAAVLERVFRVLKRTSPAKQAFLHQYQLVRGALEQLRLVPASWSLALGGLALYGALLVAPPWLMLRDMPALGALMTLSPDQEQELPAPPPDWEARLAQATSTAARWEILMEAGDWLTGSERYREAADYYVRAEKLAAGFGPNDPRLARTLVRISALGEGTLAEDRMRLQRALAIQERALGPEHLELAETLEALAMAHDWRNDGFTDALVALRRALAIRRQAQGERHPEVADGLTTLAYVYATRGMFEAAEAGQRAAVQIYQEALGPSDTRTRFAEERLANLYLGHAEYEKAIAVLEATLQSLPVDTVGADSYFRSRTQTALGWARTLQGDHASARQLFEAALRDHGEVLGGLANDVSRVPLLLDLVYLHASRKNWNEAQEPFEDFVSLVEGVMQISPEAFATRLERQGDPSADARLDWNLRRGHFQAEGIRLMLEQ
jgi:Zn-dependent protease/tetratricopeptide (TPR) repeat protein